MERAKLNYYIDVGLAISFVLVACTGIIKFPKLLPGLGISYQSLPMRTLSIIHDWSGVIMTLLVLVHLILHWKWIVAMTKSIFRRKE